jgi:Helix-turn-helix domain
MPVRPIKLTTAQAARLAHVRPSTVRWWVKRGHIERTKDGKIDGASLAAYLDTRGNIGQRKRDHGSGDDEPDARDAE